MLENQIWIINGEMMDRSILLLMFLSAFINEVSLAMLYSNTTTPLSTTAINSSNTTTSATTTNTTTYTTTSPTTSNTTSTTMPTTAPTTSTTTPATFTTMPTPTFTTSTTTPATFTTTPTPTSTTSTTTPATSTTTYTTTTTPTTTRATPTTSTTTATSTTSSTSNPLSTTRQPTGNTCPEETLKGLTFPPSVIGQITYSTQLCPPGTANAGIPMASAQCLNFTIFHAFGALKLLNCALTLELFESKVNGTLETNMYVASSVQILTSKPEQLTSQNITSAAMIANSLLSSAVLNETVAVSAMATISQLMQTVKNQYSEDTYDALESLTKTLEDFALNISSMNSSALVQPNLVVQAIKLSHWTPQVQFFAQTGLSGKFTPEGVNMSTDGADAANLTPSSGRPVDLLLALKLQNDSQKDWGNRNLSIGVVLYENDRFFNSKHFNSQLDTKRRVLSASLTDKHLLDKVEFTIRPENKSGLTPYDFACVFWDYAQRDWRTEGCIKIQDPYGFQCKCNHTTNFAVLMSFRADYNYSEALNWISIVGCSLSIVGLLLTTIYQIKTRKLRGANSTMLLVNICLCMTTYYLLFIFGINNPVQSSKASVSEKNIIPSSDLQQKVDQGPCTAITALLQYFLLATFAWNIMYAAHVFFLIRNALSGPPRGFRTIAMTAGWGLPAVIVGISLATTYSFKDPLGYRQEEFCWLASLDKAGTFDPKRPMLWGFLLPLAVMLCFNTALLVYFSQTICCANPNLKSSRTTPLKKKILSSFSLAVVLGLSWVIGYFVLITRDKTLYIILSVVFCLCNTTQGVQIFLLFTLKSFLKTRARYNLDSKTESRGEP
ncbi:adhesion G-protein coupled receptor G7-like isoform X1 [Megalobrama amblycephala]|uniref:adhesion G-protein coupled receptor G7-like isoform X1 n=1 Tax=Megalobrama amblycephala TaxID=75352 RepID=UPI002013EC83|nr:adhesion G-protein coupled receptor G7-like isoform X1 [Megalobrama amblycephala]XP_048023760.1 adhesion G-protein coupled receptor G7-like isoform X1 [Megalobrama amblycephala]XP_048023770.1 adhesion G-protein coupled receptor G7-like isoform X1 [Megalobrama amblycephala]XP_048023778.1 adhesion G-protein coupled receptor G7-like isoform X1 [Megalobrama amblycephala]